MAHILARKRASGTRYTAVIRINKDGVLVHRESKTFALHSAAEKWAKAREVALEDPSALVRAKDDGESLRALIQWYIDTFRPIANWQRTKQSQLEFLKRHPFSKSGIYELTSAALVDHVRVRRADGAGPATVGNDLTWIHCVLKAAKSVKELPVNPQIVEDARTACRELRLIAKSRRRDRRPTATELKLLHEHFVHRDRRSTIPMNDVHDFAIESARREAEITRLEWADNDEETRTGLVRDAKHPRAKDGNHRRFKYTPEAWAIVQRQPKTSSPYIFPYDSRSISAAFTRACKVLGIHDLCFHDARHEATSRLFERGYQIQEVAQFTLHDSWNELKRYTNLRPENLRDLARPKKSALVPAHRTGAPTVKHPARAERRSTRRDRSRLPATGTSDRPT